MIAIVHCIYYHLSYVIYMFLYAHFLYTLDRPLWPQPTLTPANSPVNPASPGEDSQPINRSLSTNTLINASQSLTIRLKNLFTRSYTPLSNTTHPGTVIYVYVLCTIVYLLSIYVI